MKRLPRDSELKEKPASTQAETIAQPRVLVTAPDHMATTLSWPAAPYTAAPSSYDSGPQLSPLIPAAARFFASATPYSHTPESPTTPRSPSTSWSHARGQHINSQQTFVGDSNVSTEQPRKLSGGESSNDGSSLPPRGAKRQLGAQIPKRYQF